MKKSLVFILAMLMVVSMVLSACSQKTVDNVAATTNTAVADKQELTVNFQAEPNSIDWQKCSSNLEIMIFNTMMEGLTRTTNGAVKPGIAEKWETSPDGLTWTFHLRDAKWTDGQPVKAQDFYYGALRSLDPKDPKEFSYYLFDIVGAEDYNIGKGTVDKVGIKVVDDKTIQYTLKNPVPYFTYLASFPNFGPCRQDIYEKYGDKYNVELESMVVDGPFKLESWKHESEMVFVKNSDYWDKGNIKLDKVTALMINDESAEFNMYEAGELDETASLTAEQIDALTKGKAENYYDGTVWYFLFNNTHSVLKNANIRKALTLAIDRKIFIENVAKQPWKPALAFVQPDIVPDADGKTSFRDKTPEYFKDNDIEGAKAALAQGMKELGITSVPKMKLLCNDAASVQQYAQAFQEMWKKSLNIEVEIEPVPSSVRLSRQNKHDFDMSIGGWSPDYPDAIGDLDIFVTNSGTNNVAYSNPEYDKLIEGAKLASDVNKRFEMLHQAEDLLMKDMPIGPIYYRYKNFGLREYVKNLHRVAIGGDIDFIYAYIEGKGK